MAMEFNRIITLLRKERGITQKQAAQELGISQAQLSHYEKGIRECGLEFVVQIADYYNVSCDYLLGRSAERSGQTIKVEELPDAGGATSGSIYRGSVLPTMYKKLIENSLDILFDRLDQCKDKRVVTSVSNYLMLAVYRMFRRLYQAAPGNVASMFRVTPARWERDADAATLQAALAAIVRKTDQIGRLIDDLLFLARSESGSIMVNRSRVVLQDIVGDVLLDGGSLSMRPGVRIRPRQPEEPVEVRGDPDRLRQAVMIALDNAVRLAPEGTTVTVELARSSDHAHIRVHDQGPGFTGDELGSAFTRFYSARPSRPRSGRGLGLGLSIAKWIVDQHDGTIRIDSAQGRGAVVEITMPLAHRAVA